MTQPTAAAAGPTIPLAVEDRIALEHFGHTLTDDEHVCLPSRPRTVIQRALAAAYASGWRAGVAERNQTVTTDKPIPIAALITMRIAARGVPQEKAKAFVEGVEGAALEQKILLRMLSGREPNDAIDDELKNALPVILAMGGAE